MKKASMNGVEVFPFSSEEELLTYIDENKGILVAINAEKILHATVEKLKTEYEGINIVGYQLI